MTTVEKGSYVHLFSNSQNVSYPNQRYPIFTWVALIFGSVNLMFFKMDVQKQSIFIQFDLQTRLLPFWNQIQNKRERERERAYKPKSSIATNSFKLLRSIKMSYLVEDIQIAEDHILLNTALCSSRPSSISCMVFTIWLWQFFLKFLQLL